MQKPSDLIIGQAYDAESVAGHILLCEGSAKSACRQEKSCALYHLHGRVFHDLSSHSLARVNLPKGVKHRGGTKPLHHIILQSIYSTYRIPVLINSI
jgi:hypothetical protein